MSQTEVETVALREPANPMSPEGRINGLRIMDDADTAAWVEDLQYVGAKKFALIDTTLITDDLMADEPLWRFVKGYYRADAGPYMMALASVMNAILTQQSYFFILSRRCLWHLIENDKNHKTKFSLGWKQYSKVLSFVLNSGLLARMKPAEGRKAGIFKVIHTPFVDSIWTPVLDQFGLTYDDQGFEDIYRDEWKTILEFRDKYEPKEFPKVKSPST